MTKKKMLDKIYEVIANKELSPWCNFKKWDENCEILLEHNFEEGTEYDIWFTNNNVILRVEIEPIIEGLFNFDYTIIWHPVMIGDALDWIEKNWEEVSDWFYKWMWELNRQWKYKRKPIDDNPECIKYIYNLIQVWNE